MVEEWLIWGSGGGGCEEKMIGCHWVTWDHRNRQHRGFINGLMRLVPSDQEPQRGSLESVTPAGVPGRVKGRGLWCIVLYCTPHQRPVNIINSKMHQALNEF